MRLPRLGADETNLMGTILVYSFLGKSLTLKMPLEYKSALKRAVFSEFSFLWAMACLITTLAGLSLLLITTSESDKFSSANFIFWMNGNLSIVTVIF